MLRLVSLNLENHYMKFYYTFDLICWSVKTLFHGYVKNGSGRKNTWGRFWGRSSCSDRRIYLYSAPTSSQIKRGPTRLEVYLSQGKAIDLVTMSLMNGMKQKISKAWKSVQAARSRVSTVGTDWEGRRSNKFKRAKMACTDFTVITVNVAAIQDE